MATIELCPGSVLGTGFQLHVSLSEIHVPRMWVEEDNQGHHVRYIGSMGGVQEGICVIQACMLTFYPEFEVDSISENEVIFLLDLSNSMKVCRSLN